MGVLDTVVSIPGDEDVCLEKKERGFGLYETRGRRSKQEDTAAVVWYDEDTFKHLSVEEIGWRLWTSYKIINEQINAPQFGGSTASTTVYDGKGNLITATLGDSVTFVVVYDLDGNIVSVTRLNETTDHPDEDKARLARAGASVFGGRLHRINNSLAMARALGDVDYLPFGLCDDAHIKSISLASLTHDKPAIVRVITMCDGFTEPLNSYDKEKQEAFLLGALQLIKETESISEAGLAALLAGFAATQGSGDNISVAVQTLSKLAPFLIGIYDGHGGDRASYYIARNIKTVFEQQCALSPEEYAQQKHSVHHNFMDYYRDHPEFTLYEPLAQAEKKVRTEEIARAGGIQAHINILQKKREVLVEQVVGYTGDDNPFLDSLAATESLILFFTHLCEQYTHLNCSKKEFIDCTGFVWEAPTKTVNVDKYTFLSQPLDEVRYHAAVLKSLDDLQPCLRALAEECKLSPIENTTALRELGLFSSTEHHGDPGEKLAPKDVKGPDF